MTGHDVAYEEEIIERSRELQDLYPGLDYEAAISRARIEMGRRKR